MAFSPLLKSLRTVFGARVSLRDTVPTGAEHINLSLGLWENPTLTGQPCALLYLDADAASQLQTSLESMVGMVDPDRWSNLAIKLMVSAGRMPISAQELATLECGDILLLPAWITADVHEFTLRQRRGAWAAGRLGEGQFIINRLVETTMSDYARGAADEPQPITGPEQLEITLRFDLGELKLSLGELQQVQPGYSFALDLPVAGEVSIVAGEQLIGRGELVQIDERLGVRVTALFDPHHV
jgi:type III secretion system YscQ/HrcQ family protein